MKTGKAIFCFFMLLTLVSCGGGGGGSNTKTTPLATLSSITITSTFNSVPVGQTIQLTATGNYSDNSTANLTDDVTWTVSDTGYATISTTGRMSGILKGSVEISATYNSISSAITVYNISDPSEVTLSNITITSALNSIQVGETVQLTATANYSDNSSTDLTGDVTWTVSDTDYATISTAGLVSGLLKGTIEISAAYNGISSTQLMTIYDLSDLSDLIISSKSTSIPVEQQIQIDVLGLFSDDSIQNVADSVTFSITSGNASITETGLLTGTATGNVIVKVCLSGICKDFEITINSEALTQIVVSAENSEIPNGLNIQLTATGTYSDGSTIDISNIATWVSSNNDIAEPNIETPSQFITKQAGIVTATATYGDKSANIVVTILETAIESIVVTRESGEYPRNYFTFLKATGIFTDGTTINLTNNASWSVNDTSIARVFNEDGYTGFLITIAEGSVEVTATYNSVEKSETINISSETLSGFDIKPDSAALYLPLVLESGNSINLEIFGIYSDGTEKDFSPICNWYSLTNDILSISNSDPDKGNVSSITEGDGAVAVIIGKIGILQPVTIIKPVVSYTISTTYSTIPTHSDIKYTAEVLYDDSTTGDITGLVIWNSDDTDVMLFDDNMKNFAHALTPGSSTIGSSLLINGTTEIFPEADIPITVEPLISIDLQPYNSSGDLLSLSVNINDVAGFVAWGVCAGNIVGFNITNYVEWISDNESYISVSDDSETKGEITINALGSGPVNITAEADDGTGTNINIIGTSGEIP